MSNGSNRDKRVLIVLCRYYRENWMFFLIGFLGLFLTSGAVLSTGKILEDFINGFTGNDNHLTYYFKVMCSLMFCLTIGSFLRSFNINYYNEKSLWKLVHDTYKHVLDLPTTVFNRITPEDMMSRFSSDVNVAILTLANSLSFAVRNTITLIGSLALIIYSSPTLSVYVLFLIPVFFLLIILLGRKVRALSKYNQETLAVLTGHINETISGIKVVQAFCQEDWAVDSLGKKIAAYLATAKVRILARSSFISIMIAVTFFALSFLMSAGQMHLDKGDITRGELYSFIYYAVLTAIALGGITESMADSQRAFGACARILELLDEKTAFMPEMVTHKLPEHTLGDIRFDMVNFTYPRTDRHIIHDFSLDIKHGDNVAIVGSSGAGKSTICSLLLRLYEVSSGSISVDGTPISSLDLRELRGIFGYVPSEPAIFKCSMFDNIAYGSGFAVDENRVITAAKAACISYLIDTHGLNYELSAGRVLSTGQKQCIAIARALVRKPKVLLFDEAFSALDYDTERSVRHNIDELMPETTKIFVTHRLSTIHPKDKVVVLSEGYVDAVGTHNELCSISKTYMRLLKAQSE